MHNIPVQTFTDWCNKFGGLDVPEARCLKDLESENTRECLANELGPACANRT